MVVAECIGLTKSENHLLDQPVLSCNDANAWTSTVVVRVRHLGPQSLQQEAVSPGPMKGSQQKTK